MAATVGIGSDFPYVKIVSFQYSSNLFTAYYFANINIILSLFKLQISAESMIGLSEGSKCAQIVKVFEDAYKSTLSIIVLDDIER